MKQEYSSNLLNIAEYETPDKDWLKWANALLRTLVQLLPSINSILTLLFHAFRLLVDNWTMPAH